MCGVREIHKIHKNIKNVGCVYLTSKQRGKSLQWRTSWHSTFWVRNLVSVVDDETESSIMNIKPVSSQPGKTCSTPEQHAADGLPMPKTQWMDSKSQMVILPTM